ncbi:MAG: dimethylsulfonioproprionate lyase family protein [Pseudomonadota bacterium]
MSDPRWERLLTEMRAAHTLPELAAFCDFPQDPKAQATAPHEIPASELLQDEEGLKTEHYTGFRDALINAAPLAHWRETYKGTDIGGEFLDRFGCYEVLGEDAPYACDTMRCFIIYAPSDLYYPWHHHPAEELYLVLAGEAEFFIHGEPPKILRPGDTVFHESNVPHAMTTHEHPVLAYVLWRGDLETKPVWTTQEALQ